MTGLFGVRLRIHDSTSSMSSHPAMVSDFVVVAIIVRRRFATRRTERLFVRRGMEL